MRLKSELLKTGKLHGFQLTPEVVEQLRQTVEDFNSVGFAKVATNKPPVYRGGIVLTDEQTRIIRGLVKAGDVVSAQRMVLDVLNTYSEQVRSLKDELLNA